MIDGLRQQKPKILFPVPSDEGIFPGDFLTSTSLLLPNVHDTMLVRESSSQILRCSQLAIPNGLTVKWRCSHATDLMAELRALYAANGIVTVFLKLELIN